jgi:hypothetical protein
MRISEPTMTWTRVLGMRWVLLLVAASVPACTCGSPADDANSTVPKACEFNAPQLVDPKTDILFIIDNSNSMTEEQAEVAAELPAFIDELKRNVGVNQDFRVGVITTGVYRNVRIDNYYPNGDPYLEYNTFPAEAGRLQPVPNPDNSPNPNGERFLEDEDPDLVAKFSRLVKVGILGSGQETPLEAARLAVTPPLSTTAVAQGGNSGFFRDGARLLVVLVTDEDDCSELVRPPLVTVGADQNRDYCTEQAANLAPLSAYYDVFRNLTDSKGAARPVLWAAIAPVSVNDKSAASVTDSSGVHNVDCATSRGPGIRQRAMAELFDPSLKNLDSICKPDFRQSLIDIAVIANNTQVLEVNGVPDPRLLQLEVTRADGTKELCTLSNGGIQYQEATETSAARILFQPSCARKRDDQFVEVKLFCVG